jgi:hypothetical protein
VSPQTQQFLIAVFAVLVVPGFTALMFWAGYAYHKRETLLAEVNAEAPKPSHADVIMPLLEKAAAKPVPNREIDPLLLVVAEALKFMMEEEVKAATRGEFATFPLLERPTMSDSLRHKVAHLHDLTLEIKSLLKAKP